MSYTESRSTGPIEKGDDRAAVACPCGCASIGSLKRKVMKDGKCHVRGCVCRRCIGSNNRKSGLNKQRVARRAIGIPDTARGSALSDEENWRHSSFRCEVKSGQLARSVATQYLKAQKQADANKAIGDARPLLFLLMPAEWGQEGLAVVRLSTWTKTVRPLLAEVVD